MIELTMGRRPLLLGDICESAFGLPKVADSDREENKCRGGGDKNEVRIPRLAENCRSPSIDDTRHRIQRENPSVLLGNYIGRVDDGAQVHQQLYAEGGYVFEVSVGDRQRSE